MNELSKCPFCGWTPVVRSRNAKGVASGKHYFVRCPMCHTEGPRSTTSEAAAIQKWNERAEAEIPGTVQCKKCLAITNEGNGCESGDCPISRAALFAHLHARPLPVGEVDRLHAAIMNIRADASVTEQLEGHPKGFYLLGHRDARLAAAALVAASQEKESALPVGEGKQG